LNRKILVVDDSPLSRHYIINELQDDKTFELYQAHDGEEAIHKAFDIKPDLITMDIEMPGIDGFEACRRIKENEACRNIPIIIITSHDNSYTREKGFNSGVIHFFNKNFKKGELKTYISTYLFNSILPKQEKVLVYDKSLNVLSIAEYLLKKQGYYVESTHEIDELDLKWNHDNYSLYLFDLDHYEERIFEYIRFIQNENSHAPIVITVTVNERNTLLNAFKAGIHDYLIKPFYSDEFIYRIDSHIRRYANNRYIEEKNRELEKALTQQKTFYAFLSHDIRGPVINSLGFFRLIRDGNINEMKVVRELAEKFIEKDEKLLIMIDQFLEYIKTEFSSDKIKYSKHNLIDIINESYEQLQEQMIKKKIHFEIICQEDVYLSCDRILLIQVLVNLIGNSVKFTEKNGYIQVYAKTVQSKIRICVKDNGQGIDKDTLPHLFDEFYTKERKNKGFGIGLAIVKKIIEAHKGTVFAHSEKGNGAEIGFEIPIQGDVNEN